MELSEALDCSDEIPNLTGGRREPVYMHDSQESPNYDINCVPRNNNSLFNPDLNRWTFLMRNLVGPRCFVASLPATNVTMDHQHAETETETVAAQWVTQHMY